MLNLLITYALNDEYDFGQRIIKGNQSMVFLIAESVDLHAKYLICLVVSINFLLEGYES